MTGDLVDPKTGRDLPRHFLDPAPTILPPKRTPPDVGRVLAVAALLIAVLALALAVVALVVVL